MSNESDDDVKAISTIISALKPLDESARVHVLEFVLKRLGISLTAKPSPPAALNPPAESVHSGVPSAAEHSRPGGHDIRSFGAEKKPKTNNEKVAVMAYYIAHLAPPHERRDYVVPDDIQAYFIQADFHLPTAPPSVTLGHAKNAGYLNALDRGRFKLNPVGYNLVAHKLPSDGAGETKRFTATKPAKRGPRRKAKK